MARKKLSDWYRLRTRLGINKEHAAELCGVTVRTVENWDKKGAPDTAELCFGGAGNRSAIEAGKALFFRGRLVYRENQFMPESLQGHRGRLTRLNILKAFNFGVIGRSRSSNDEAGHRSAPCVDTKQRGERKIIFRHVTCFSVLCAWAANPRLGA